MAGGQLVRNCGRSVLRAIVDGDYLELLRQSGQSGEGLIDQRLEVRLFVVGRKEEGKLRDPNRSSPGACGSRGFPTILCAHWVPFVLVTRLMVEPLGSLKSVISNDPLRSEEHTSELQSRQYLVC